MKIMLAVDGSDVSKRMLAYLAAHEELLGPKNHFTVLTVVAPLPYFTGPALGREVLDEHYKELANEVLGPIRSFAQQKGWPADINYAVGPISGTIATQAEEGHFDMVVMGTHGHSSLGNLLMGSVATGVLARCKVPVLLIR